MALIKKIPLSLNERKRLTTNAKKMLGQVQNIVDIIESDRVTDATFIQLLAIKGSANRICKDIISHGVIPNLSQYSPLAINKALDIIFKL